MSNWKITDGLPQGQMIVTEPAEKIALLHLREQRHNSHYCRICKTEMAYAKLFVEQDKMYKEKNVKG